MPWEPVSWASALGLSWEGAITPREVYVVPAPPPPPPVYYGPAAYGPQPWSPGWYRYCRAIYGPSFNPNTGYFLSADGGWYYCQ